MKRTMLALMLAALCSSAPRAQMGFPRAVDDDEDYPKAEVYVGFSQLRTTTGGTGFNGFEAAVTGNVARYVGLKFDVSGNYRSNFGSRLSIYNFLGGAQLKNNSRGARFKPFVHALAGAARLQESRGGFSDTGFSSVVGVGLDIRASRRVDIRILQADYNLIRLDGQSNHNYRLGAGIVIH